MYRRSFLWVSAVVTLGILGSANAETSKNLFAQNESNNFIISYGFLGLCDHVCDMRGGSVLGSKISFNPKKVKLGDTIFVRNIDTFMREKHPFIDNPYIIITHGYRDETNFEYQRTYLEEDNIIAWFSIHPMEKAHDKYHPIPLGVSGNKSIYRKRRKVNTYLKALREKTGKSNLVYLNFNDKTASERAHVRKLFTNKPFVLERKKSIPFNTYLKEMATCKFVLSPRGSGPDCFRTWEALLVGSIPIVRRCVFGDANNRKVCNHSTLDDLYEGLPVVIIDIWEEVTEEFLHQKYSEIMSKHYDIRPLYLEYWYEKVKEVRDAYLKR